MMHDALLSSSTLKGYVFSFETNLYLLLFLLNFLSRITYMTYKLFYEAIKTQCHALSRISLVCSYSSLTLLRNRTLTIGLLVATLAVLDHAQILCEVISVYQSSFLG